MFYTSRICEKCGSYNFKNKGATAEESKTPPPPPLPLYLSLSKAARDPKAEGL